MAVPPVDPHWLPSALLCAFLVAISTLMLRSHRRSWAARQLEGLHDQADMLHYQGQYRRRTQTSLLMGLIGVLILLGDVITFWINTWDKKLSTKFFGVWFFGVLLLTVYLIALGVADALATAAHARAALARLRAQRRQLERQAAELKERPLETEF